MDCREWIIGYLEAILDSGTGKGEKPSVVNPTKYFVEEVITRSDETDLHWTWIKIVYMRNTEKRILRLMNMIWRIWYLTRKRKQVFDSIIAWLMCDFSVCFILGLLFEYVF